MQHRHWRNYLPWQWFAYQIHQNKTSTKLDDRFPPFDLTFSLQWHDPSLNLNFVVNEPLPITISSNVTSVTCFGGSDGSISLSVSGGTGSYNYLWSNSETLSSISNLIAGSYSVSVTDSLGCNAFEVIAIGQPTAINIIGNVTDILCNGGIDGSVDVSVSGGSGSYSYSWSNGVLTQDINAIGTGTYTLTVSDFNGCTNSSSFNVNQPSPISINATVNSINCFGNADGAINITSNGGTGTLNYLWNQRSKR